MAVSLVKAYSRHGACRHAEWSLGQPVACELCDKDTTAFYCEAPIADGYRSDSTLVKVASPGRGAHRQRTGVPLTTRRPEWFPARKAA